MIKTPLSTVIGGAFWIPSCTIIGGQQSFSQLIKNLFTNNEQGFFYDPDDLSTMFQDAAGTIPVTAVGQPVGLILDKSKGLLRTEKMVNPSFDSDTAWLKGANVTISNGSAILNVASGNPVLRQNVGLTAGKWYEVTVDVTEVTSGSSVFGIYGTGGRDAIFNISSAGIYKTVTRARSDATGLIGFSATSTSMKVSSASVKELAGNHAYQTTSAARPILQDTPRRIDFDTVDDKLITNLPAQLSGCTVIRSVPNVRTQILTGQTILATYNDNTDHCGLIVINRALTPSETSAITAEFNKRAGV
jgi:hypothetical protein